MHRRPRLIWTALCLLALCSSQMGQAWAALPFGAGTDRVSGNSPIPPLPVPPGKASNDRLTSTLRTLAEAARQSHATGARLDFLARQAGISLTDAGVEVVVELRSADPAISLPGVVEARDGRLWQMRVRPDLLDALVAHPQVKAVRLPERPVPSLITSEGVTWSQGTTWQQAGFTGRSINVAVIDTGFAGYEERLGHELPADTVLRNFRADGNPVSAGPHGTAVAEIVHDEAPGASLILVTISTEVELGEAVDWLRTQDVKVIVHTLAWFGSGPGDGTGDIADIMQRATGDGILWVNAAGNMARRHYLGLYNPAPGRQYHQFENSAEADRLTANRGDPICAVLTWDGWPATAEDYDLYLFGPNGGNPVASSRNVQNGTQRPVESFCYTADVNGDYFLAIYGYSTTHPVRLRLFNLYQDMSVVVAGSSLPQPADAPQALTVGAVFWANDALESFSAQGPTLIGQIKPDLVGADGVSTSFGASNSTSADTGGTGFFGTSAAAALVGGAAALYWSANPDLNVVDLREALIARARDLGPPGPDAQYGWGALALGPIPARGFTYLPISLRGASAAPTVTPTAPPPATATPTSTPTVPPTATETPVATPTATSSPTPTPGNCTELITNGDFEQEGDWTLVRAVYTNEIADTGSRSLRTGLNGVAPPSQPQYSSAEQAFRIPQDAITTTLQFAYNLRSNDSRTDRQYVLLYVDDEPTFHTLIEQQHANTSGWTIFTSDLSHFAGHRLRLHFEVYNDTVGGVSALYADAVSVQACRS